MFKKNIEALKKNNTLLAEKIEKIPLESIKNIVFVEAETKDIIVGYDDLALHSTIDPVKETKEIWEASINPELKKNDVLIVFGLGLGYLLKKSCMESQSRIYIIDPFDDILRFVLEYADLSEELSNKQVYLTDNIQDIINKLQTEFLPGDRVEFVFLPAYLGLAQDIFEELTSRVLKTIESKSCDANTISHLSPIWTENFISGLPYLSECIPLGFLNNLFAGKTALIMAAGPSLIKDIEKIKTTRDKFVIFSAGKVLPILTKHNIIPDFITFADAWGIDFQFKGYENILEQSNLIISLKTDHQSYKLKSKNKILHLPESSTFTELLNNNSSIKPGIHKTAGSVSIINYFIAKEMGFKNIIFSGLDFAFPNEKIYADGENLKTDENGYIRTDDSSIGFGRKIKYVRDKNGNNIPTRDDYFVFINQFEEILEEETSLTRIINTSANGAFIKGMEYIEFDEAIINIQNQPFNIDEDLKTIQDKYKTEWLYCINKVNNEIEKSFNEINDIKKESELMEPLVHILHEKVMQQKLTRYDMDKINTLFKKNGSLKSMAMNNIILQNLFQGIFLMYINKYKTEEGPCAQDTFINNFEAERDFYNLSLWFIRNSINWYKNSDSGKKELIKHE